MKLMIEKLPRGYVVTEWTGVDAIKIGACSSITEVMDFVGEHFDTPAPDAADKETPHGIRATVGTLTKATVEIVGEDDAA
jgi:hypothetical protein